MLARIIGFSIRQRWFVLAVVALDLHLQPCPQWHFEVLLRR